MHITPFAALGPSDDEVTLSSWSFTTEYHTHIHSFTELYNITYRVAAQVLNEPPSPDDCAELLVTSLLSSKLFTRILQGKLHLPPHLYDSMTRRLARYIVERNYNPQTAYKGH